jgi:hypothetical protein
MKSCLRCNELALPGKQLCKRCKHESRAVRLNANRELKLKHKKSYCEHCGFIALDKCQLDVDHIDGNRDNNEQSNYRTLCANCHRLKTQMNKDHSWADKELVTLPSKQLKLVSL